MTEHKTPLVPYLLTKTCVTCGDGEMCVTGLEVSPAAKLYSHMCSNKACAAVMSFPLTYPRVQFFTSDGRAL